MPGFIKLLDYDQEMKMVEEQKILDETFKNELEPLNYRDLRKKFMPHSAKAPEQKYIAIAGSSYSYTFHESEKLIIDRLREWALDYFK